MNSMDSTLSVSKGVFVFKNNVTKRSDVLVKNKRNRSKQKSDKILKPLTFFDDETIQQIFYKVYKSTWDKYKYDIDNLQKVNYANTISELISFIKNCYTSNIDDILPTAALLTGINQPDHLKQFETVAKYLKSHTGSRIIILESRDCSTLKNSIESMIFRFIQNNDSDEEDNCQNVLRKSQYTMQIFSKWYGDKFSKTSEKLIVILPDFECFNPQILQDFILILSSYCNTLPIVLIMGIATLLSNLHNTLPYHVTSKIQLKIFQMPPALEGLNTIIQEIILSPKYNFHLSGKMLNLLTDIFLFYDFSVNGFVQAFKNCLMEHFLQGNSYGLCSDYESSLISINSLKHDDYETIRRLTSFRQYVERSKNPRFTYAILTDDKFLEIKLPKLLKNCHIFFKISRCLLEFLFSLLQDLPKSPFGKTLREVYVHCTSKEIIETEDFKQFIQILKFYSKDEFIQKLNKAIKVTKEYTLKNLENDLEIDEICKSFVFAKLNELVILLNNIKLKKSVSEEKFEEKPLQNELKNLNRQELKNKLFEMTKQNKPKSECDDSIQNVLKFIEQKIIYRYLCPLPKRGPALNELFVCSDIQKIRKNIVGAPRAALHIALNDPNHYLQCSCCKLNTNQQLLTTLPDLSIAYKLHLECGKLINLFDWLQAFRSVVELTDDDNEIGDQVDPLIQARFTRAIAELQFLGYIKTSKKKTDHVSRLTW